MKRFVPLLFVAVAAPVPAQDTSLPAAPTATARAQLKDAKGRDAGSATFSQVGGIVKMKLDASGLDKGRHGIHIHETGKCDPPDFKSAGAHFNPHGRQHGTKAAGGAHAGDLPNLSASEDGLASANVTLAGVTLDPGAAHSLLDADGSAVVIHAKEDDEKTDPSGGSGDRIVCGVIKPAAP